MLWLVLTIIKLTGPVRTFFKFRSVLNKSRGMPVTEFGGQVFQPALSGETMALFKASMDDSTSFQLTALCYAKIDRVGAGCPGCHVNYFNLYTCNRESMIIICASFVIPRMDFEAKVPGDNFHEGLISCFRCPLIPG
jgi:hypothetical protein